MLMWRIRIFTIRIFLINYGGFISKNVADADWNHIQQAMVIKDKHLMRTLNADNNRLTFSEK